MATHLAMSLLGLLLAGSLASTALGEATPNVPLTTVNTTSGVFTGFQQSPDDNITAFLGIPYAAPPVGSLRFAPPAPYNNTHGQTPQPATTTPKACMQLTFDTLLNDKLIAVAESEDCLTLNVWRPTPVPTDSPLPVLVWLHGGAFQQGSSTPTDGLPLLRASPTQLVVSLNYRLNIFGFPTTPALAQRNLGLRDQRFALEWLRANIRAFGGDPSRMVLMGQSGGSQSVAHYAFAYPSDPIVRGLIMWSGQPEGGLRDSGAGWTQALHQLGCDNNENPEAQLTCMRGIPARTLKRAVSASNFLRYDDFVDGWAPGSPTTDNVTNFDTWGGEYVARGREGRFARVPVWIQHVAHDGDNLVSFDARQRDVWANGTGAINQTEADATTLMAMHCPAWLHAGFRVDVGGSGGSGSDNGSNLTVYRSVYNGTFPSLRPYPWMRAYHAEDIYLFFGAEETAAWGDAEPETRLAGVYLRQAVAAFVRDPERGLADFGWAKYTGRGETLQVLFEGNEPMAGTIDADKYDEPCREIWGKALGSEAR